jgi:hypothetical protein
MSRTGYILASLLGAFLLHTVPAAATTITVNCDEKMTIGKAITFLNPMESNTVRVIGTCNEFVAFMALFTRARSTASRIGRR